jgi:nucleotide-binding universal stress UspA family protein
MMNPVDHVLLASHGTQGAIAAEDMALKLCKQGATLHHLIVIPTLWKGMTGDDWLNNGSTRDTFRRYLESEIGREMQEHSDRVSDQAKQHQIHYTSEIVVGEPEECLIQASNKDDFDIVVIGSPRPKGISGLRSRMSVEPLVRSLRTPLLIVPYPNE